MFDHDNPKLFGAVGVTQEEFGRLVNTASLVIREGMKASRNEDGSLNVIGAMTSSGAAVMTLMQFKTVEIATMVLCCFRDLSELSRSGVLDDGILSVVGHIMSVLELWGVPLRVSRRGSELVEEMCAAVPKVVLVDKALTLFGLLMMINESLLRSG